MVLHVLSPSLEAPNRLTFNDLPLTTTVAELKERISQSIPSRPSADKQRLIYRGKPLVNDRAMLQNILEPPDVSCPRIPQIARSIFFRDRMLNGRL